jgi:dihydropteroate synthase
MARAPWCNTHPLIMGILNVTPDSFSDGAANTTRWKKLSITPCA